MPQWAITHSGSNASAFRKHFTPSALLKAKHQLSPASNQRCASPDAVEIVLEWLPRSKRSIRFRSSARSPDHVSRFGPLFGQSSCDRRRQPEPISLLDRDIITGVGMTQHADAWIAVQYAFQSFGGRWVPVRDDRQAGADTASAEAVNGNEIGATGAVQQR